MAQGASYNILTDPFPGFRFTCSKPYRRRPLPLKETDDSRETIKKAGSFFVNLFKKSPASKSPSPAKILRPALRPLILPGMLTERSGSHSPVSVIKGEASPLASGLYPGSHSLPITSPVIKAVPLTHVAVASPPTLGNGNPTPASTPYPDATIGPTGSRSTADSIPLTGSRTPSSLSPMVAHSHPNSLFSVGRPRAGSIAVSIAVPTPHRSRSRSSSRAPLPSSRAHLPGPCPRIGSRPPVPGSRPPVPTSHRQPPVGSRPPRNTIRLEEYPGAPPGLQTRPQISKSTHNGRQGQSLKDRNTGPKAASNNPPPNHLGRAVHSNVLLNGAGQQSRHTPSVPRTSGKPQGQQNVRPNFGRSRSASPPLVSSGMNRQYPTCSPSVASPLGSQPYLVKFDLIPDDMLIGRRHPAFLPSVPNAPGSQSTFKPGPIAPPQVSNDATIRRRRPSAPSVPGGSFPRGPQPVKPTQGRSRSVTPAIAADMNRINRQRNFSAPSVSHISGYPCNTPNTPRVRARSDTYTPAVSSTPRNIGPPPTFPLPPVPTLPERFLRDHGPQNTDRAPASVPTVFCEDLSLPVPVSSASSTTPALEISREVPATLVSRLKSWIRRMFLGALPEPTIRHGPKPTN